MKENGDKQKYNFNEQLSKHDIYDERSELKLSQDEEDDKEEKTKNNIESILKNCEKKKEAYDQNKNYLQTNPWKFGFGIGGTTVAGVTSLSTILASCFDGSVFLGACPGGLNPILASSALAISSFGIIAVCGIGFLILSGGFLIYSLKKNNKIKDYMEKIKNDNSMEKEREIYFHLVYKIINYFFEDNKLIKLKQNKYFKAISNNSINNLNERIDKKINEIPNEINHFNVLVLGNTGVGKSTLINCFLKLRNNLCKVGKTAIPEIIDEWKRYPVNDCDSEYKGISLYDSNGIISGNINQHLEEVKKFIENYKSKTEKQIHCIWFCIHKSKFDPDEENYINNLLEIYDSKEKIPIIFIFTQAYITETINVDNIRERLKQIKYFKEGKNRLNYIEVIAEQFKVGSHIEPVKNLNELREMTINCTKEVLVLQ